MEQASKQNQNNATNPPKLQPVIPEKKLHNNEIGVKSELKGREIKRLVDRTIDKLIYKKLPTVILKARGKSTSKLISIIDILRSKIVGLYVIQKTYSTKFKSEKEPNKDIEEVKESIKSLSNTVASLADIVAKLASTEETKKKK